jgi:23S rRNA pseudouridine1911/1915/1917 synthase
MSSRKPRRHQFKRSHRAVGSQHSAGRRKPFPPQPAPHSLPATEPKILFDDSDLLVALKPVGLATANVPNGKNSLLTHLLRLLNTRKRSGETGGPEASFLGVVSRLDQPVSGVVVFARSREAAASLSKQFRERTVRKIYHALIEGRFPGPVGELLTWTDLLERPPSEAAGPTARPPSPQEAVVEARLVARGVEASLVELRPRTGRRHQLRVQLGSRNCPIIGDRLYGSRLPFPVGIALHASQLSIDHPSTGQRLTFSAGWPIVWRQAARGLVLPSQDLSS